MSKRVVTVLVLMGLMVVGVQAAYSTTISCSVDMDTWVGPAYTAPQGADANLWMARSDVAQMLLQFDMSAIPSDAVINSVTLYAYNQDRGQPADPLVTAHKVTGEWAEDVIWSNRPAYEASAVGSWKLTALGGEMWDNEPHPAIDNALVQGWVDGTIANYGLAIFHEGIDTYAGLWRGWDSKENASGRSAYLLVDYTSVPEPASLLICLMSVLCIRRRK